MAAQRKTNTSVTLDSAVLRDAKRLAKQEHRSLSSFVEHSLWLRIQDSDIRDNDARGKAAPAAKPAAKAPAKKAAAKKSSSSRR